MIRTIYCATPGVMATPLLPSETAESSQAPVIPRVTKSPYAPRDFSVFMAGDRQNQLRRLVLHVIVYNASGASDARLAAFMAANGTRLASPAIAPNSFGLR